MLEAMAARNPIVAIEASGVVEVVENNVNGFMTGESIEEWGNCVCTIIGDNKLRSELGENAYNTAKLYIDSNIAKIAEENYGKVISNYYKKKQSSRYGISVGKVH